MRLVPDRQTMSPCLAITVASAEPWTTSSFPLAKVHASDAGPSFALHVVRVSPALRSNLARLGHGLQLQVQHILLTFSPFIG